MENQTREGLWIWERDACQSISSIYKVIAAVTLAINHGRQFLASTAEGSIDGDEDLRRPLSQVVVLARGGCFTQSCSRSH